MSAAIVVAVVVVAVVLLAVVAVPRPMRSGPFYGHAKAVGRIPGGTGLDGALSWITDTPGNRADVVYSDTASLVKLTGDTSNLPVKQNTFAGLRFIGAMPLTAPAVLKTSGINLPKAAYTVSAGLARPAIGISPEVTVAAGGQDGQLVTDRMTKLGWKERNDALFASGTGPSATSEVVANALSDFPVLKTLGPNVITGQSAAAAGQAGAPTGMTLGDDPMMNSLAGCLGNVVAAEFISNGEGVSVNTGYRASGVTEIAVGDLRPATAAAKPHVVVCASWPSKTLAARYESKVRAALAYGTLPGGTVRYSTVLQDPKVTSPGGPQYIVRWQATAPDPSRIFLLARDTDLPALTAGSPLGS